MSAELESRKDAEPDAPIAELPESVFALGWEEWVSLPQLGLPAVKVKVDTGARTSALHADAIEGFGPADRPKVRFVLRPVPDDDRIEIPCSAPVKDRRLITSSNGESEMRFVIETPVRIGDREWIIELTLTNRDSMAYRMLLGRTAIGPDMVVSPTASCVNGELGYGAYRRRAAAQGAQRPLRIAILTREPKNYSTRRLLEAAGDRGHEAECVNTIRCTMPINAQAPSIHYDGKPLPRFDAVIPRIGASITSYGLSVVRQFEAMGAYVLNASSAIAASRDKLHAHQLLARQGIDMPATAFARSPADIKNLIESVGGAPLVVKLLESTHGRGVVLAETRKAAESLVDAFRGLGADFLLQEFVKEAAGQDVRCLVIRGRVVAAMRRVAAEGEFRSNLHRGGVAQSVRLTKEERSAAVRAARALGLAVAGVDILRSNQGPKVLEVNSSPGLEGVEKASGKDVAGMIMEHAEVNARSIGRRSRAV